MEDKDVTMVISAGVFICGILTDGNKLKGPRMFSARPVDPTDLSKGIEFQMSPPPGEPPFVSIGTDGFRYKIPHESEAIYNLYERVTTKPNGVK